MNKDNFEDVWGIKQTNYKLKKDNEELKAENTAIRALMDTYNLGGWTDAIEPMKRALKAEAKLEDMYRFIDSVQKKLTDTVDQIMKKPL